MSSVPLLLFISHIWPWCIPSIMLCLPTICHECVLVKWTLAIMLDVFWRSLCIVAMWLLAVVKTAHELGGQNSCICPITIVPTVLLCAVELCITEPPTFGEDDINLCTSTVRHASKPLRSNLCGTDTAQVRLWDLQGILPGMVSRVSRSSWCTNPGRPALVGCATSAVRVKNRLLCKGLARCKSMRVASGFVSMSHRYSLVYNCAVTLGSAM